MHKAVFCRRRQYHYVEWNRGPVFNFGVSVGLTGGMDHLLKSRFVWNCPNRQMSRRKRLLHMSGDLIYQLGQPDGCVGAFPAFERRRDDHGFIMILKPDKESGFIGAG